MPAQLPEPAKRWLDAPTFVTLATLDPDGSPQCSVLWVARDGDDVVMSTVKGRRKHANLLRDSRATLLVTDPDNPYAYLEVRGRVTMSEQGARELIDDLNEKYTGSRPYPHDPPEAQRVVLRLRPEKVVARG